MATFAHGCRGDRLPHVPALDGVRGIAILVVMVVHFSLGFSPRSALEAFAFDVVRAGWATIDVFFVLSGFLITRILLATRGRRGFYGSFLARRLLRIVPLYYASLALAFWVLPACLDAVPAALEGLRADQAWMWLYAPNYLVIRRQDFLPYFHPMWSLGVEEQFYVAWPAAVAFLRGKAFPAFCALAWAAAWAWRAWCVHAGESPLRIYVDATTRVDALAAGAWVAYLAAEPERMSRAWPWLKACAWLVAPVTLSWLVRRDSWQDPLMQAFGYTGLNMASAALVAWCLQDEGRHVRVLSWAPWRFFGKHSYALYIVHWPLRVVSDAWLSRPAFAAALGSAWAGMWAYAACLIAVSTALAWLAWHGWETHFLALKRFFPVPAARQAEPGAPRKDAAAMASTAS